MATTKVLRITDAAILKQRKSLPEDINDIPLDKFVVAMRRTTENLTLRVSHEVAAKLVYLDMVKLVPKATVAKKCIDLSIEGVWKGYVG